MATEIDIAVTTTTYDVTIVAEPNEYVVNITTGGGGGVQSVTGTTVDNTDPLNPIVGVPTLQQITDNESGTSVTTGNMQVNALIATEIGAIDVDDSIILRPQGLSVDFQRGSNQGQLNANGIDNNYSWELPNASGTIALTSDIPSSAVDSVNGQTGAVVLDAADVGAEPTKGSDDNYVTDAQLVVIGNTSGTNSGDNATNTTSNAYADGKVTDAIADGVTTVAPSQNAVFDALALRKRRIINDTASVSVTGTTALTLVKTFELTTGTLPISGILDLFMYSTRTGANGVHTMGLYINTTNNFATATLIGTATTGGNFTPILSFKGSYTLKNNLLIGSFYSNVSGTNYAPTATQLSVACNNTSASVWLFVGIAPSASGQTVEFQSIEIVI